LKSISCDSPFKWLNNNNNNSREASKSKDASNSSRDSGDIISSRNKQQQVQQQQRLTRTYRNMLATIGTPAMAALQESECHQKRQKKEKL
jgi:hypothetical protein